TNIPIYAGSFVWVMNQSWYDRLDDNQRAVIDNHCSQEWALKAGGAYADWEDEGRETLRQTDGHTVIELEPNETQAWKAAVAPVAESWAEDVRKLGKDPQAILGDLKEQLSKHGALY